MVNSVSGLEGADQVEEILGFSLDRQTYQNMRQAARRQLFPDTGFEGIKDYLQQWSEKGNVGKLRWKICIEAKICKKCSSLTTIQNTEDTVETLCSSCNLEELSSVGPCEE